LVACNFSKTEQKFDFKGYENAKVLISNYDGNISEKATLKPYSAIALLLDDAQKM
jgi:hypothetical protein